MTLTVTLVVFMTAPNLTMSFSDFSQYVGDTIRELRVFDEQLAYFAKQCDGRPFLLKDAVHPRGLAKFLPRTFIFDLEVRPDGKITDIRSRLLGTELVAHYGELTGTSVLSLPDKKSRDLTFSCCQLMLDRQQPVAVCIERTPLLRRPYTAHLLYLPVSVDGATVTQVLGFIHRDLPPAARFSF